MQDVRGDRFGSWCIRPIFILRRGEPWKSALSTLTIWSMFVTCHWTRTTEKSVLSQQSLLSSLFFLPPFFPLPGLAARCESGVSGARLSPAPGSRSKLMISLDDLCLAIIQSIIMPAQRLSNNLCLAMALQYADMAYLALFIGLNGSWKTSSQSAFHRFIHFTSIFMGS